VINQEIRSTGLDYFSFQKIVRSIEERGRTKMGARGLCSPHSAA